jgi:hypothetical protein
VLHPMAEYSSTPQRGTRVPLEYHKGYHFRETHGDLEIFHSAIRAPRSGRLLLRRDLIFELVNTVVSEVRKRAFSARS